MNYTGIDCPVCNQKFNADDDVVVCPVCGTPHHRSCWNETGICQNAHRHSEGFIWQTAAPATNNAHTAQTGGEALKTCPRCGEKNATYEPVCTRCGERLKANRETIHDRFPMDENRRGFDFGQSEFGNYDAPPNPNNFSPYQNVYAADARTIYGADTTIEDISVTEVAEYVQKNSNMYIGKFLDMQEKKSKVNWNWSAAIFSVFWCFYRKMTACGWALMAIFLSCYMLSSFVPATVYENFKPEIYNEYVQYTEAFYEEAEKAVTSGEITEEYYAYYMAILTSPITVTSYLMMGVLFLLINVIFGLFANHFYKKKVLKDIRAIRQVFVDSLSYHMYLRGKGGVSNANAILPILIFMAFSMLLSYI
ncbi:MAG: hypothetical protein IJZ35_00530 [Clostridia bacterium]|nr:hypothetical protein [Clostridia bacterium]